METHAHSFLSGFTFNQSQINHIQIARGAPFNQAILKCHVDHHNGTQNNLYMLLNSDCRLHFLNILVIVDYKYSTTDNNMYKLYILCQSIPFIAKKIDSRNMLDKKISVSRL